MRTVFIRRNEIERLNCLERETEVCRLTIKGMRSYHFCLPHHLNHHSFQQTAAFNIQSQFKDSITTSPERCTKLPSSSSSPAPQLPCRLPRSARHTSPAQAFTDPPSAVLQMFLELPTSTVALVSYKQVMYRNMC